MPNQNDEAGVLLNSNGAYWQAVWRDSSGERRRESLGPKSKVSRRQALRECRRLETEHAVRPGRRDARQAPTLAEWIERFRRLRTDMSESTGKLYDQTADCLYERIGADTRLDRIDRATAAEFRAWLSARTVKRGEQEQAISEQTVRKHIRNCKVLFSQAVDLDIISANPFGRQAASPVEIDAAWRYLKPAELDAVLTACPDSGWRAMFGLCRLAGLRAGEALRLQWSAINWDRRTLKVEHEGKRTTKKRRRIVPIQPRLYAVLLERFEHAQPGESVTGRRSTNMIRDAQVIIKRAELEPWAKPFHTLRKNCETDWLAEYPVMDVCRWLGHAPTVAARHYHQVKSETMDQVTGRAAEREQTEIERLRQQIKRERARTRRVLRLAREARKA